MEKKLLLQAKKIGKTFYTPSQNTVLQNISLSIAPEEKAAIIGPSGSGKSTLLHILATLEMPSKGKLFFNGSPIETSQLATLRSKEIGVVFQSNHLLNEFSAIENLLLKARIARRATHQQSSSYQEALSLLESVGLSHRILYPVKLLSGGEKQRVAIARAMMNNPKLILADEPTGNLDAASADAIQSLLIDTCKEFKKSLIVVTHDKEFAARCDRVWRLEQGTLRGCVSLLSAADMSD